MQDSHKTVVLSVCIVPLSALLTLRQNILQQPIYSSLSFCHPISLWLVLQFQRSEGSSLTDLQQSAQLWAATHAIPKARSWSWWIFKKFVHVLNLTSVPFWGEFRWYFNLKTKKREMDWFFWLHDWNWSQGCSYCSHDLKTFFVYENIHLHTVF